LAPLVVPQLKIITLGGAVTGLGIESTSFRNGLPHESVLEMGILTGAGEIITASSDQNADLVAAMDGTIETGRLDGVLVDYLDGVVFSADEGYLCAGRQTSAPGPASDYTDQQIYYRSIQHDRGATDDRLTIHDYLWRWDTDWFWCSEAFGAQHPLIRRIWPGRYRRSSNYAKLMRIEQRFHIGDRIKKLNGRPPRERVVQDVEVPLERCAEFLDWFLNTVPIEPIWLCPLCLKDHDRWPLYPIRPQQSYVNVGFWSTVPVGSSEGETNRLIERKVGELDGHKSLYADSYYSRPEFDEIYGGQSYRAAKKRYDPDSRLLDLYSKAMQRR
jgi:FAD/FMN-containing dehydrogenase